MIDFDAARFRWHPVAASDDLPYRHVFHAQILARELAIWRADDGHVNAWENRCLHRGVRLSIGINDGTELICQYHGWRYANRTAGCTYIPAHPADAPARSICNNTYPTQEYFGLIWTTESNEHALPIYDELNSQQLTPLRAIAINAPLHRVSQGISKHSPHSIEIYDDFTLVANSQNSQTPNAVFFLQPQTEVSTIVRGVLCDVDLTNTDNTTLLLHLRNFNFWMSQCRDRIEAGSLKDMPPTPWVAHISSVSETNASIPELNGVGRKATLRVRVTRIESIAQNIRLFVFESIASPLPAAQAGAHIDVHLPNGLIRQYSLTNGPGQTDHYAIAVKLLDDSAGGSLTLHTNTKIGDVLATSVPRNNFTLRRDADHTLLIAGGIGITPLLSMARALNHSRLSFELHYFVSSENDIVFRSELQAMSGAIHFHIGQSVTQTGNTLNQVLNNANKDHHVYLCGPGPMISKAQEIAVKHEWPDKSIHFEYFKNTRLLDASSSFTVELARSGLTLSVPGGETLLSVLRDNNVAIVSSCEQGACGTCRVAVIDGEPEHQDVYLSDSEKREGKCMMVCVSRAKSSNLVLDL